MADAAARNARLTSLVAATNAWATARTTALNNQATALKAIIASRSGSGALAQSGADATSALVVSSIDGFLSE